MEDAYSIIKWKTRYIRQLIKRGLSKKGAEENYDAGISCHDFNFLPEDAANDELGYWTND